MGLRQHPAREVAQVNGNASAAELGLYTLLGSQFSCIPPVDYPAHEGYVRAILKELGDTYRPLWVTNHWRSPNGGTVRRCHHVLGHYDPNPKTKRRLCPGLLLPTTNLYGIEWRNPIYVDDMLDGLNDRQRQMLGKILPKYEPLDADVLNGIRYHLWKKRHKSAEQQDADDIKAEEIAEQKADESLKREAIYRKHNDRIQIGEAKGTIARSVGGVDRATEAA